jgi:hypothetical protein
MSCTIRRLMAAGVGRQDAMIALPVAVTSVVTCPALHVLLTLHVLGFGAQR